MSGVWSRAQRSEECPVCGAQPGRPCITISGRTAYQSHAARYLPAGSFRERHVYRPYRARNAQNRPVGSHNTGQ